MNKNGYSLGTILDKGFSWTIVFFIFCYLVKDAPFYQESITQAENIYTNTYFILFRIVPIFLIIFWIYAFRGYIIPENKRKEAEKIAEDKRINKQWLRGLMKGREMQKWLIINMQKSPVKIVI